MHAGLDHCPLQQLLSQSCQSCYYSTTLCTHATLPTGANCFTPILSLPLFMCTCCLPSLFTAASAIEHASRHMAVWLLLLLPLQLREPGSEHACSNPVFAAATRTFKMVNPHSVTHLTCLSLLPTAASATKRVSRPIALLPPASEAFV